MQYRSNSDLYAGNTQEQEAHLEGSWGDDGAQPRKEQRSNQHSQHLRGKYVDGNIHQKKKKAQEESEVAQASPHGMEPICWF